MNNLYLEFEKDNEYKRVPLDDFLNDNKTIKTSELNIVFDNGQDTYKKNIFNPDNESEFNKLILKDQERKFNDYSINDLNNVSNIDIFNQYLDIQKNHLVKDLKSAMLDEHFADSWGNDYGIDKKSERIDTFEKLKENILNNKEVSLDEFSVLSKDNSKLETLNKLRKLDTPYNSLPYEKSNLEEKLSNQIKAEEERTKSVELEKNDNLEKKTNNQIETKKERLKSVELEKSVIQLLPKEDQEQNFKETLSRLEKNKSSLKDDLKSFMTAAKVDEIVNSVKKHFENIKVKAEDIYKNFKDLGKWNQENNFVKNIDNVINKVKGLSRSDKIDINDPNLLSKLENKFNETNKFIEKVETQNSQNDSLQKIRMDYLKNTLSTLNYYNDKDIENFKSVYNDIDKMSSKEKIDLYNYSKDLQILTENRSTNQAMKTSLQSHIIGNYVEKDLGKNITDQARKDYLLSDIKKPDVHKSFSDSKLLSNYVENGNNIVEISNKVEVMMYKNNAKTQLENINNNQKANSLKNNSLLQKFNQSSNRNKEAKIENQNRNNDVLNETDNNEKQNVSKKSRGLQQ